jgi:DNA-binding NarL/FixJ family response regulator
MELSNPGKGAPGSNQSRDEQSDRDRIRIVLLDDHVLFRESLARLSSSEHDLELVAECAMPPQALETLSAATVDVLLADLALAKEFIPCACKAGYRGKFLVIERDIDVKGSAHVLSRGASGIFLGSDRSARLMQAIRLVASGEAWVDQKVIQLLADRYPDYEDRWRGTLTEREQAVLKSIVDGLSNRKIGTEIGVSESTIKAILQQLFNKAGVRTRSQLVRIALEGPPLDVPKARPSGDTR